LTALRRLVGSVLAGLCFVADDGFVAPAAVDFGFAFTGGFDFTGACFFAVLAAADFALLGFAVDLPAFSAEPATLRATGEPADFFDFDLLFAEDGFATPATDVFPVFAFTIYK